MFEIKIVFITALKQDITHNTTKLFNCPSGLNFTRTVRKQQVKTSTCVMLLCKGRFKNFFSTLIDSSDGKNEQTNAVQALYHRLTSKIRIIVKNCTFLQGFSGTKGRKNPHKKLEYQTFDVDQNL